MRSCIICGRKLKLFREEKINHSNLDAYSYSSRKIPEYMHYALYECENCHVLYSDCTVEKQEIFRNYKEADYDSGDEADNASRTYYKYLCKYLPNYQANRALDIGTGNGGYLEILMRKGIDVVGIEPSDAPIRQAAPAIRDKIINDVFKKGMFEAESFDIISLFQTIEHIPDTENTLQEIFSLLSGEGYFYLVCHDYRSLINRILGDKSPIYDIEHLQIFSKKGICRILKKTGYREIKVFTIWNKYPLKYWMRLFPLKKSIKDRMLNFLEHKAIGQICIPVNVGNIGIIAKK